MNGVKGYIIPNIHNICTVTYTINTMCKIYCYFIFVGDPCMCMEGYVNPVGFIKKTQIPGTVKTFPRV